MVQNAVDGRPLTEGLLRNVLLGAGLGALAPLAIAAILPAGAGMLATAGPRCWSAAALAPWPTW
jgi:hypothetical protein